MNLKNNHEIKLEKIPINLIDIIAYFNVREDFGKRETKDLEESLKITKGNIQPIIVCKKNNRYELIAGERRIRALKETGKTEVLGLVYEEELTELQKTQLMFNENMGRKYFTWKEELKALKRLQMNGFKINSTLLVNKRYTKQRIWDLLEAFKAVEEFPELLNETTRRNCLTKYRIKKREEKGFISVKKITIKEIVNANTKAKNKSNSIVIEELKEELAYYKNKSENLYNIIKIQNVIERISNGIWLSSEVKQMIKASKTCEKFGMLDKTNSKCKKCKNHSYDIFSKCEFYKDELGKINEKTN
jgi:ParB family chromosome partitioning protein